MSADLKHFLSQYIHLSDEVMEEVTSKFRKWDIKKGDFLMRQGEICKHLAFVQKGCLRLYYLKEGIEVSVWFAFPKSSAIEIHSFISEAPSGYFLQAIEDSEVLCLPKAELGKLCEKYPEMHQMMRNFWEDVVLNLISRFTSLQKDSAGQRYQHLLAKPDYLQSIPQKYLASFIGVTPTSLSRIRRKALQNPLLS